MNNKLVVFVMLAVVTISALGDEFSELGSLRQLKFSADGKFILAQDESAIVVLSAEPLGVLLRVRADKEVLGHFTPDSHQLVFVRSMIQVDPTQIRLMDGTPRVERWDVRDRMHVASSSIPNLVCGSVALAPDGGTLACDDMKGTLQVVDVKSGKVDFTKRKFARARVSVWADQEVTVDSANLWAADFEFSPDGRFLIAVPKDDGDAVIWDRREKGTLNARGQVKMLSKMTERAYFFAFLSPDRLAIARSRYVNSKKALECDAVILKFPSGDVISTQHLPRCPGGYSVDFRRTTERLLRRAADPKFLIITHEEIINGTIGDRNSWHHVVPPTGKSAKTRIETSAVELSTGRMIGAGLHAVDIFGNRYVEDLRPGEIGLWERGKGLLGSVVVREK